MFASESNLQSEEKMIELTSGRDGTNLEELGSCSTMLTLCPKFPPFPFIVGMNGSFFQWKHRGHVVCSSVDIVELSIRLMVKRFRFEEGRM